MKKLLVILFCLGHFLSVAREKKNDSSEVVKNAVYLELFGNGLLGSLNYERIVFSKNNFRLATRIGIFGGIKELFSVPSEINFIWGRRGCLELSPGITYGENFNTGYDGLDRKQGSRGIYLFGRIGFRYQKMEGGPVFRIGIMPVVQISELNPDYKLKYTFGDRYKNGYWGFALGISYGGSF